MVAFTIKRSNEVEYSENTAAYFELPLLIALNNAHYITPYNITSQIIILWVVSVQIKRVTKVK